MREKEHGLCACTERQSPSISEGTIDRTGAQTMLYLICTTITSVDFAYYGVSRAKDWVSVDCGTIPICLHIVCAELWGNRSIDIS